MTLRMAAPALVTLIALACGGHALIEALRSGRLGGAALAAVRAAAPFPRFPPGLPTAVTTFTSQIEFKIE